MYHGPPPPGAAPAVGQAPYPGAWESYHPPGGPPPQQWAPAYKIPEPQLRQRIDKTLDAVLKSPNPAEFAQHLRMKQGENPDFQFLTPGGVGNAYFEGRKHEILGSGMYFGHGHPGDMSAMPPNEPRPPPFPPLVPDAREISDSEKEQLENFVKDLNGTKDSIKAMSKWLLKNTDIIGGAMQMLTKVVQNIDFNNFGKKLHVCYVINDVLHESVKLRDATGKLDKMSAGVLHNLPGILQSSFQGYSPQDQDKMHNLLILWCDRQIFSQDHINYMGNVMITPINPNSWQYGPWGPAPSNLLHLSPGFVIDIVNRLIRDEKYPAYTPIPLCHIPPCMPEKIPKTPSYILDKYDDFQHSLDVIDQKTRRRGRSRSRSRTVGTELSTDGSSSYSRSPRRDYRRTKRRRFSRSPARTYSRSTSSSRSRS